jgi:hypothetical protein
VSEPSALRGPDRAAGVPIASVQDGIPLLGHAYGEPVSLVKRDRRCSRSALPARMTVARLCRLLACEGWCYRVSLPPRLAAFGTSKRHAIGQTDARGDRDTLAIFTEISRGVDTYLWFVEAPGGEHRCRRRHRRTPRF